MSIEEYKHEFISLCNQMEEEHGKLKGVEIETHEICDEYGKPLTRKYVKIQF